MSAQRLHQLHAAGRRADQVVAWRGDQPLLWIDYHARVAALYRHLVEQPGCEWILACPDPFDFAVGLFALWHANKVALIPSSFRPGALEELSSQVDGGIIDDAAPFLGEAICPKQCPASLPNLDASQARLDLFTSGSTGEAKRVTKKLAQLDAEVSVLERVWGQRGGPIVATVPHHHIYGLLFRLLWPLSTGRAFDCETCASPEQLLDRLNRIGRAVVISSPSHLARMPDLIPLSLLKNAAGTIFSSGGPLSASAAAQFHSALGEAPLEVYGSTETGGIAWRIQTDQADDSEAWTPQLGVAVTVAEDGALTLSSPFLSDDQPLSLADAGEMLADGRFRLLGRLDRVVKIEEKRLSLSDMEERLRAHAWIKEACTVALPGRRQNVGALLVLTSAGQAQLRDHGRHAFAQQLRKYLGHWFDAVLLPRRWRYRDSLPYNERGKLVAADIIELFGEKVASHE